MIVPKDIGESRYQNESRKRGKSDGVDAQELQRQRSVFDGRARRAFLSRLEVK